MRKLAPPGPERVLMTGVKWDLQSVQIRMWARVNIARTVRVGLEVDKVV